MKIFAYAKINLALNVNKRLDNGYHDLTMCMVPINLYDDITIEKSDVMNFTCNKSYVSKNPNNTILKAVDIMRLKYGFKDNFNIHLNKYIPTKAGLAGGSADGAMIIKAIDKLLNLNMSENDIKEVCLKLGADVLFVYYKKPSLVEGIGDNLTFIDNKMNLNVVVVKPKFGISTKKCYEKLNLEKCDHPDVLKVVKALETNDYDLLVQNIGNSLEHPSFKMEKGLNKIKKDMYEMGLDAVLMSGSGSSIFGISKNIDILKDVEQKYRDLGYFSRVCEVMK